MTDHTHYETVATICRKSGRECPAAVKAAERLRAGLSGTVSPASSCFAMLSLMSILPRFAPLQTVFSIPAGRCTGLAG